MTGRLPPHPVPAGVSPAITAAWTKYFKVRSLGDSAEASDAVEDIMVEEMDAAASRLATTRCRSLHDIAAKALFVIYAENEIGGLTSAEDEVRVSVPADVLAMAATSSG